MLTRSIITGAMLSTGLCASLAAADMGDIEIHGFASIGYLKTSDNAYLADDSKRGSMEFNEFGINMRSDLDDRTSVGIQLFSRDLGDLGNNEILVDWAYLDYNYDDRMSFRVGRVKLPSTFYNEYQDVDAARTTILMPQGVHSISFRDVTLAVDGVTTYGNIATPNFGDFDYNVYFGIQNPPKNGSVADAIGADELTADMKYVMGGNLIYNTPLEGLRVNYSYAYIKDWRLRGDIEQFVPNALGPGLGVNIVVPLDLTAGSFISQSFGVEYTWRDWIFASEYLTRSGTLNDTATGAGIFDINWGAWYLQADYRLDEQWAFAAYYSEFLEDRDDTDGSGFSPDYNGWQKDFAFAVRYDVNDFWILKAEVHSINGTALSSDDEEDWTLFALKSTVTF